MKISFRCFATIAVALMLSAIPVGIKIRNKYVFSRRPLFYNVFVSVDPEILPSWHLSPIPIVNSKGDMLLVDRGYNLLVLIVTMDHNFLPVDIPKSEIDPWRLKLKSGKIIEIPKQKDKLLVFETEKVSAVALPAGTAISLFQDFQQLERRGALPDSLVIEMQKRISTIPSSETASRSINDPPPASR